MKDRQIILTRLIAASPDKVWRAWTDPALLPTWFGPAGYSCKTKEIDLRIGGQWRFDMIGPDGTVYANRHRFSAMVKPARLEFVLDGDDDAGPQMAVVVEMVAEGDGTRITQTMTFPSVEHRDGALAFGADVLGQTTLAKLEALARQL